MKIVFDLDGVLRDLHTYLKLTYGIPYATNWNWKYKGLNIFQWIKKDNYKILLDAPATEYLKVVKKYFKPNKQNNYTLVPLEIWTNQPEDWLDYTLKWINKHIGKYYFVYLLTNEQKRQELNILNNHILVEDNPKFKNYDRILLIDRPYNQKVKAKRIYTPQELEKEILKYQGE